MKQTAKILSTLSLIVLLMLVTASLNQVSLGQQKPAAKPQPMAQTAPPSQMLSINVVRIKPEMLTEYQEFVKNEAIPTMQKGGVKVREAWTTANFGEGYEYTFVSPIENWASYDSPGPIVKALGQDGARAYGMKARKFIASTHTSAVLTRTDLSYIGKLTWPPKMAVVNSIHVAPGRGQDFENILKNDILPALKKADVIAYLVNQTVHGGNSNEYITLTIVDSFAEIGKGSPVVRGMGGQEAYNKFASRTAGIVVHQERSIMRYVPDLSITAAMPKTENK
jgi:hypothetical protein